MRGLLFPRVPRGENIKKIPEKLGISPAIRRDFIIIIVAFSVEREAGGPEPEAVQG